MTTVASSNEDHQPDRSSERSYQILRRMLICGQIPPGTRLREVEWSEKLECQRAALREAMVLLVHDGLLIRRSSGGFFTPQLNEINIDCVVDARIVLEVGAIKLTGLRQLEISAFRAVENACEMMERCHAAGMGSGFAEADFLFHQKLLELSGNTSLIQMFSHSAQLIYVVVPVTGEKQRMSEQTTILEHRHILALLQSGEVEQAAICLEKHLGTTKAAIKSAR